MENKGFTLVELIVVITILAILATVAFISFTGYTKTSRDAVRQSDITNIGKMLSIESVKNSFLPLPNDVISLSGSGVIFQYQGSANQNLLDTINVFNGGLDPITSKPYTYALNKSKTRYEVGGKLETEDFFYKGYNLGFLYNSDGESIHESGNNYELLENNEVLTLKLGETQQTGTGGELFSFFYNNSDLNESPELVIYDQSLVGLWDFENYYQADYDGETDVIFIEDKSNNHYDFKLSNENGYVTDPTGVFINDQYGTGIMFDEGDNTYSMNTLKYGTDFDYASRSVNAVPGDILNKYIIGDDLTYGMSATISLELLEGDTIYSSGVQRILGYNLENKGYIASGDALKSIDASFIRIRNGKYHQHITPYNDYLEGVVNGYSGVVGCGDSNNVIDPPVDVCSKNYTVIKGDVVPGHNFFTINTNFYEKEQCLHINGQLFTCDEMSDDLISRIIEEGYAFATFKVSSQAEKFNGNIYSIQIFDRLLTESEITVLHEK